MVKKATYFNAIRNAEMGNAVKAKEFLAVAVKEKIEKISGKVIRSMLVNFGVGSLKDEMKNSLKMNSKQQRTAKIVERSIPDIAKTINEKKLFVKVENVDADKIKLHLLKDQKYLDAVYQHLKTTRKADIVGVTVDYLTTLKF